MDSVPGRQDSYTGVFNDPLIVDRLRAGEELAFELVFEASATLLLGFAYSYVRSASTAQDVVADTFAHLWDQRKNLQVRYGLKAYLFAAVRHRALNALRRETRTERLIDRLSHEREDESADLPPEDLALDAQHLSLALRQAIHALPADRQRLVKLRWYDGLTVPQIAHILELSVGAVEQRLLRTLQALRRVLDKGP